MNSIRISQVARIIESNSQLHTAPPKIRLSENTVQMLLELWQLKATTSAVWSLFQGPFYCTGCRWIWDGLQRRRQPFEGPVVHKEDPGWNHCFQTLRLIVVKMPRLWGRPQHYLQIQRPYRVLSWLKTHRTSSCINLQCKSSMRWNPPKDLRPGKVEKQKQGLDWVWKSTL